MKFIKVITVLCVSLFILTSCKNPLSGSLEDKLKEEKFELGEEFEIGFEKTFINNEESIQIKFTDVLNEARCPADVKCVWAGNSKISIMVKSNKQASNIELDTHNSLTTVEKFENYSVRLVKLNPYSQSSQKPIPEKEYVATFLVDRDN